MTEEDIVLAGSVLRRCKVPVGKVRFSGGEPLLHPRMKRLFDLTVEHWRPGKYVRTYSSGKVQGIDSSGLNVTVATQGKKARCHDPFLISPEDAGLKSEFGFTKVCQLARGCGRGFDRYGFMPCPRAWSLGRLFGFDGHSAEPVGLGTEEMCKHCIHSVSTEDFRMATRAAARGGLEYPSIAFRRAIERRRVEGFKPVSTFKEKLDVRDRV